MSSAAAEAAAEAAAAVAAAQAAQAPSAEPTPRSAVQSEEGPVLSEEEEKEEAASEDLAALKRALASAQTRARVEGGRVREIEDAVKVSIAWAAREVAASKRSFDAAASSGAPAELLHQRALASAKLRAVARVVTPIICVLRPQHSLLPRESPRAASESPCNEAAAAGEATSPRSMHAEAAATEAVALLQSGERALAASHGDPLVAFVASVWEEVAPDDKAGSDDEEAVLQGERERPKQQQQREGVQPQQLDDDAGEFKAAPVAIAAAERSWCMVAEKDDEQCGRCALLSQEYQKLAERVKEGDREREALRTELLSARNALAALEARTLADANAVSESRLSIEAQDCDRRAAADPREWRVEEKRRLEDALRVAEHRIVELESVLRAVPVEKGPRAEAASAASAAPASAIAAAQAAVSAPSVPALPATVAAVAAAGSGSSSKAEPDNMWRAYAVSMVGGSILLAVRYWRPIAAWFSAHLPFSSAVRVVHVARV